MMTRVFAQNENPRLSTLKMGAAMVPHARTRRLVLINAVSGHVKSRLKN